MLRPLLDRALVKLIDEEETTKSGFILSSNTNENTKIAEIIAVGSGGKEADNTEKIYVKKGDKVIINRYSGSEIKYEGDSFIILKQEDILAVIE